MAKAKRATSFTSWEAGCTELSRILCSKAEISHVRMDLEATPSTQANSRTKISKGVMHMPACCRWLTAVKIPTPASSLSPWKSVRIWTGNTWFLVKSSKAWTSSGSWLRYRPICRTSLESRSISLTVVKIPKAQDLLTSMKTSRAQKLSKDLQRIKLMHLKRLRPVSSKPSKRFQSKLSLLSKMTLIL